MMDNLPNNHVPLISITMLFMTGTQVISLHWRMLLLISLLEILSLNRLVVSCMPAHWQYHIPSTINHISFITVTLVVPLSILFFEKEGGGGCQCSCLCLCPPVPHRGDTVVVVTLFLPHLWYHCEFHSTKFSWFVTSCNTSEYKVFTNININ